MERAQRQFQQEEQKVERKEGVAARVEDKEKEKRKTRQEEGRLDPLDASLFTVDVSTLTCCVCLRLAIKPPDLPCGHLMCGQCSRLMGNKASCPMCRRPYENPRLCHLVKCQIARLNVRCRNADLGCQVTLTVGDCDDEGKSKNCQTHLAECVYEWMPCANLCGEQMPRSLWPDHEKVCPRKKITCPNCHTGLMRKDLAAHCLHPDKLPCRNMRLCPLGCVDEKHARTIISEGQEKKHVTKECPQRPMLCEFCNTHVPMHAMTEHNFMFTTNHMHALLEKITHQDKRIRYLEQKVLRRNY